VLRAECHGETPAVGDLVTAHPDGVWSDRTVTARVTGVHRVLKPVVDPPGAPLTRGMQTTYVAVTAKVES
jgi:hypothetical protein